MRIFFILLCLFFSTIANSTTIYMSPQGRDTRIGLYKNYPVKTLSRVQEILYQLQPSDNVIVRIAKGTYKNQSVEWRYKSNQPISFIGNRINRPIFDGLGKGTWFKLINSSSSNSLLKFKNIKVINYCTAMVFRGNRNRIRGWNGKNHIIKMIFRNIGGKYSKCEYSTGAIILINSRNNLIEYNGFYNIENSTRAALIHAIYIAHNSKKNHIRFNKFKTVSGDPIRIRDNSNYNKIKYNKFIKTGVTAYFSDWFCVGYRCTKSTTECPSYGNQFRYNELYGGYIKSIPIFRKFGDRLHCGLLPAVWLWSAGNKIIK